MKIITVHRVIVRTKWINTFKQCLEHGKSCFIIIIIIIIFILRLPASRVWSSPIYPMFHIFYYSIPCFPIIPTHTKSLVWITAALIVTDYYSTEQDQIWSNTYLGQILHLALAVWPRIGYFQNLDFLISKNKDTASELTNLTCARHLAFHI